MIEGTQLRGLARQTQRNSILHAAGFARFYHASPGHTDLEEIRQFHPHLNNDRRLSADAVNRSFPAFQLLLSPRAQDALKRRPLPARQTRPQSLPHPAPG